MKSVVVVLQGGQFDGRSVPVRDQSASLSIRGPGVPEGQAAHYRALDGRKRDNTVFRFDGFGKVLATIARPGGAS